MVRGPGPLANHRPYVALVRRSVRRQEGVTRAPEIQGPPLIYCYLVCLQP